MSNTVKSRFAGLLRGLLGRKDPNETTADMEHRPVTAAAPDYLASSAPAPLPSASANTESLLGENEITLPMGSVIAALPMDLRAKIIAMPPPGMTIRISVDIVVPQLAFGAVKISFGELRMLAAGIFSNSSSSELDSKPVNLPLNEILSRINPALIARRHAEQVEVDEEIKGPFTGRGQGVTFTTEPLKTQSPKPAPRMGTAENIPPRRVAPVIPRSNPPAITPSAPIAFRQAPQAPVPSHPMTPPASRMPITSITGNGTNSTGGPNGSNGSNGGSNGHHSHPPILPSAPKIPATPVPAPTPSAPVAPRVEPAQPTIFAGLWDLAENWPDELKDEISSSAIANANLPLAGNLVDAGLKRGRITMTWKEIRLLVKPSSTPSANDGLELELPLKVIAPLFFAAKKNSPSKKSINVSSEIPNLFFGFPQSAPEAPSPAPQQSTPTPRPIAATPSSAPAPAPKTSGTQHLPRTKAPATPPGVSAFNPAEQQLEKKNGNTNFYVWGDDNEVPQDDASAFAPPQVPQTDFTSRRAMPKEVVEKAISFRGVAGALVTLPDGLRVASNVPVEFNADTLAAFIPQIFERMNQSASELRMGALNNVSFTVGNVPWRIFRVNSVYLAAFGRAGESLPAADLAALAGELDRKK